MTCNEIPIFLCYFYDTCAFTCLTWNGMTPCAEKIKLELGFVELRFFMIECETTFFKSLEQCSEVVIMFSLGSTVDDDVITEIFHT